MQKQKCEICGQWKKDAFHRAEHGRVACGECHQDIIRADTPTGLVPVPRLVEIPAWMRDAS